MKKIRKDKKACRVEALFSKQGEQAWVVVPVLIGHEIWGYIAVLENYERMRELEWNALQQACAVIAMSIFKQRTHEEIERRRKNEFVFSILEERDIWRNSLISKAHIFKLPFNIPHVVMKIDIANFLEYYKMNYNDNSDRDKFDVRHKLLSMLAMQLAANHKQLTVACKNDIIVVLCPVSQFENNQNSFRKYIAELCSEINTYIDTVEVSIGVSSMNEDFKRLPEVYKEAQETLNIGRLVFGGRGVYHFVDLGTYQLLFRLQGQPDAKKIFQNTFGPLNKLDNKSREEMIKTLDTYFIANKNIAKLQ